MRAALLILFLALPVPAEEGLDREISAVVDLFYDIRLDEAEAAARELSRRHPGHPAGPFYAAIVVYGRYLFEDPRKPETIAEFERRTARALESARAWESRQPAVSAYYRAAAHGFRGRVLVHEKRYRDAIGEGRQSVAHVRKAVKLDPAMDDVYLGLGMFNYFMSRLPAAARPLARLLVGRGDGREAGLAQLWRAAEKGPVARYEARAVLAAIYSSERERQWEKADGLLKELMGRYPRNPSFRLRRAYVALRQERWEAAVEMAACGGDWLKRLDESLREHARQVACYRKAEALLLSGRAPEAAPVLEALDPERAPRGLAGWLWLRKANLLQALEREREARELLARVEGRDAGAQAKACAAEPFPACARRIAPLHWPLSEVSR